MDYELIFEKKQHYLTTPQLRSRRLCFGNVSIEKAIKNQDKLHDLFITKYAEDGIVQCVILDFDDKDNPDNALKDAMKLRRFLHRKGCNTIIVQSGSKGYHVYIQLPPRAFGNDEYISPVNKNARFNRFQELLIGLHDGKTYDTLDLTNMKAGLRGNIRVIGSIHPRTGNQCKIVEGEFLEMVVPCEWEWSCFEKSTYFVKDDDKLDQIKHDEFVRKVKSEYGIDPVQENDLRTLMPNIYGGTVKTFQKGYIMMQCPFHSDRNPSLVVTKEYYYCKSCGEKGNWWSLRKKGVVDFKKEELIRVGECV